MSDLLSADLQRALGERWEVAVADGPTLIVTDGERTERVLFAGDVDVDAWPEDAWRDEYREHTLADDASEAVAEELFDVLRLWDVSFSPCPTHTSPLVDVCSMTWVCPGPPSHDLAPVGSLTV